MDRTTSILKFAIALSIIFTCLPAARGENLDFAASGETRINGIRQVVEKRAELYAEVTQIVQGTEGITILFLRPLEARKVDANGNTVKISISGMAKPFSPESTWTMFDAQGAITQDVRYAHRVLLPYPVEFSGAPLVTNWDECDGALNGNYVGLPCSKNRGLSDDYLVYLKLNYLPCINESLQAIHLPPAISVHIEHDGTTADNQHNRFSLHTVGRAIDVREITTTFSNGQSSLFDFTATNADHKLSSSCSPAETDNCKFFERFRACWGRKQIARRCPPRHDGPIGTIGWEDARHIAHHLHTSYPFCPNNKGYFITKKVR